MSLLPYAGHNSTLHTTTEKVTTSHKTVNLIRSNTQQINFLYLLIPGGQRNWIQVLCNGGMAAQLGLLYLLDVGASERPIDFVGDYRASWLSIGMLGKLYQLSLKKYKNLCFYF